MEASKNRKPSASWVPAAWALLAMLAPVGARADAAQCKVVADAVTKVFHTPTHLTSTQTGGAYGSAPHVGELIYLRDAIYVKTRGAWKRSPMKPDDMLAQEKENMQGAKSFACRHLRDETLDGEPAAVWSSHTVTDDATSDVTIWISSRTGLPLRQEVDLDPGDSVSKTHVSSRYDYRNVGAPAGVR
jgi:hypothetical protein